MKDEPKDGPAREKEARKHERFLPKDQKTHKSIWTDPEDQE